MCELRDHCIWESRTVFSISFRLLSISKEVIAVHITYYAPPTPLHVSSHFLVVISQVYISKVACFSFPFLFQFKFCNMLVPSNSAGNARTLFPCQIDTQDIKIVFVKFLLFLGQTDFSQNKKCMPIAQLSLMH